MTVKQYVTDILGVPVTRVGHKFILEAIELVLDTHEYKFYTKLSEIHQTSARYLEKAMRNAKNLGLLYMDLSIRAEIFGSEHVSTSEYIVNAAEYYKEHYEDEKE